MRRAVCVLLCMAAAVVFGSCGAALPADTSAADSAAAAKTSGETDPAEISFAPEPEGANDGSRGTGTVSRTDRTFSAGRDSASGAVPPTAASVPKIGAPDSTVSTSSVSMAGGGMTAGTKTYCGFVIDNVLHSDENGDIHYNVYVPESYDGSKPYALYFTLPGYEGLYFQGVAQNLKSEDFGFEAQKYNQEMIIAAPQLSDWGETSANQTIELAEYFLSTYNIDRTKAFASGYSGGGETMSIVVSKRPDLFSAYLQVSSKWDGEYESVANARLPVYFAIGRNDEYYGSAPTQSAYDRLHALYEKQGLTDAEINKILVLDIKEHSYFTEKGAPNEHGGGLFSKDPQIMGWLFNR